MSAPYAVCVRCCTILLVAACALSACGPVAEPELLRQAYALSLAGQWQEVLPLARQYVLHRPEDPSGHLLMGQAYLNRQPPMYALAVGELELALALERATGDLGELRAEFDQRAFQLAAYQDMAYAHVLWIVHAREVGVPTSMVVPRLHEAMNAVNHALAFDGGAEDLLSLKERLEYYLDRYGHLDPRAQTPTRAAA